MKTETLVGHLTSLIEVHGSRFWIALQRLDKPHCRSCGQLMIDLYCNSGVYTFCEKCEVYGALQAIEWWDEDVDESTLTTWKENEERVKLARLLEPVMPSEFSKEG